MPKEKRGQLKIDGKPVVEIDFKTLHPSLTYALAGLPMPGDAYDIDPWPRDLVKPAFLILLNAETKQSARAAIAHNKNMEQFAEIGSAEAHVVAGRLIADILQRHRPIARAFFSDQGARLMCIDSKISETTMMRLHAQGLVTLPVHDSYLIDRAHAGDLEEAMDFAATKAGFPNLKTETRH